MTDSVPAAHQAAGTADTSTPDVPSSSSASRPTKYPKPILVDGRWHCTAVGCGKHYAEKQGVRRHAREEHDPTYGRFKCSQCNKTFKRKELAKDHIHNRHDGVGEPVRVQVVLVTDTAATSTSTTQSAPLRRSQRKRNTTSSSTAQQQVTLDSVDASSPSSSVAQQQVAIDNVNAYSPSSSVAQQQVALDSSNASFPGSSTDILLNADIAASSVRQSHAAALNRTGTAASAMASHPSSLTIKSSASGPTSASSVSSLLGNVNPRVAASAVSIGLRQKVAAAGLTLANVGAGMGRTGSYLDEVLNGQREPTETDLKKLADRFNVSIRILKYMFLGRDWL